MSQNDIVFKLSFEGGLADDHRVDFYDVSQALIGFQRSIALTTHLVLNNEIITQSPSLKGANIIAAPAYDGSWKINAIVVATALYNLGTLENNSPLGHMVYSLYDYVISESLGTHVDYNKSIGQLYEEASLKNSNLKPVRQSQADSLIEKCSTAIKEMHRPIYKNGTAHFCEIKANYSGRDIPLHSKLTLDTYEFINETIATEEMEDFEGRVSSYNSNTYKGRVFIKEIGRPISFELAKSARLVAAISKITASLSFNALKDYESEQSLISFKALRNNSKSGNLKSLTIVSLVV